MIRTAYYSLKLKDPEDFKKGVTKKNIPEALFIDDSLKKTRLIIRIDVFSAKLRI